MVVVLSGCSYYSKEYVDYDSPNVISKNGQGIIYSINYSNKIYLINSNGGIIEVRKDE